MARLYDIRPKERDGKKIKYKKKYTQLSDRSKRRYRALVDSRDKQERRRLPIDEVPPAKAAFFKKPKYQPKSFWKPYNDQKQSGTLDYKTAKRYVRSV